MVLEVGETPLEFQSLRVDSGSWAPSNGLLNQVLYRTQIYFEYSTNVWSDQVGEYFNNSKENYHQVLEKILCKKSLNSVFS